MDSPDGKRLLQRLRARVKRIVKLMTMENQDKPALETEKKETIARIDNLVKVRDTYSKKIREADKNLTEVKEKLENKTKARQVSESSVYTEVDKIFQEFGANRAHYFGRKFEGIDIRKIMDRVSSIVHDFCNESNLNTDIRQ